MEKTAKNTRKLSMKARKMPKKSVATRARGSKSSMKTYSSLVYKSRVRRDKRARKRAEDLATLPKEPVKRFFAHLHPKRVFKYWFSLRGLKTLGKAIAAIILITIIAIGGLFLYYKKDLDEIKLDELKVSETVNTYTDRNGEVLWEDKGDGDYRLVVEGDQIATYMRQATVAIEDKNFYNHAGVDFWALIRAGFSTLSGQGVQGGSTLTQQLIKQVYFSDEAKDRGLSGIPRKIKEAILALEVEKMYDKEQIITMYLNESPYGGRRNGVESAAQTYFKKSAKDLTLAESAFLAAIPNNPAVLNPYNSAGNKALVARQQKTLDVMAEMGYISQEQAEEAKKEDILSTVQPEQQQYDNIKAPHFVLEVKKQLEEKYGVKTMRAGGFTIKTSLDYRAQQLAEQAVANGTKYLYTNGADNIALASVDVETAQVIAMVGSADWNKEIYGQVNAATSPLEPGSSIKPILDYTPLFMQREGVNYGPGSILKDENIDRIYCAGYTSGKCQLRNSSGQFYGNITIRTSLGNSLNIGAVKALYINGVENSVEIAHKLGDENYCKDSPAVLSAAIGSGCAVKPIEHANAYASLARGGVRKDLTYVLELKNSSGETIEKWEDSEGERVVDDQVAYMVSDILHDPAARTMTFGSAMANGYGFVIPNVWTATKSGTTTTVKSSTAKDSWLASYSPSVATVVWSGNHDGSGLRSSDKTVVRRVIHDYMGPVHTEIYEPEGRWTKNQAIARPNGIQTLTINGQTDIWPSWYNSKNSGVQKVSLMFNKYTHTLATECTDERFKISIEATKTLDPITDQEVWDVPEPYNREVEDDCTYSAPSVSIRKSGTTGDTYRVIITPGSVNLTNYSVTIGDKSIESGAVTRKDFTVTATASGTMRVVVTDGYGFEASDELQVTASQVDDNSSASAASSATN
ncbi:penicillin-binding protein [Candidatus Saccharibacteria bacterium]|nr:penicillin-binding protein [Candidatus Saccharibacteria bacterium]